MGTKSIENKGCRQHFECGHPFFDNVIFDILVLMCYNLNVVNQLVIRVLLPDKRKFKGIMKSLKNLLMNGKKYTH